MFHHNSQQPTSPMASSSDPPGRIFHRIALKFAQSVVDNNTTTTGPISKANPSRDAMFEEVVECLRAKSFPELEPTIFDYLRDSLPFIWSNLLPTRRPERGKATLNDAYKAALTAEFIEIKETKRFDPRSLVFEAAMIVLKYVFEMSGLHGRRCIFFNDYEDLRSCYLKIGKYSNEKLSYKGDRFPETKVDETEKEILKYFANFVRCTVALIETPRGRGTHVRTLVTRIVEGGDVKYIPGSGMTVQTRRRITIFEDETEVMPVPRPLRSADLIQVVSDPSSNTDEKFRELMKPCQLEDMNDFIWEPVQGIVLKSTEVSSKSGSTVIRMTSIYKDNPGNERNLYSKSINVTSVTENPPAQKQTGSSSGGGGGGGGVSSGDLSPNSKSKSSSASASIASVPASYVDFNFESEDLAMDFLYWNEVFKFDNDINPLERMYSLEQIGDVTLERNRHSDGNCLVRSASYIKHYNNSSINLNSEQKLMLESDPVSKIFRPGMETTGGGAPFFMGDKGGFSVEVVSLNRLYSSQSHKSNSSNSSESSPRGSANNSPRVVRSPRDDDFDLLGSSSSYDDDSSSSSKKRSSSEITNTSPTESSHDTSDVSNNKSPKTN
jgi:hypothetical protein